MKLRGSGTLRVCLRVGWILTMLGAVVVMTQTANVPFVYGAF
jgi:hypothetical protein